MLKFPAISLFLALLIVGFSAAAADGRLTIDKPIRQVKTETRVVALTFDDGPDGNGMWYADYLKKEGIKATFFVVGDKVEKAPQIVKALHDAGMEIANHSYTHGNQTRKSLDEVRDETARTQAIIETTTGVAPVVYRAPGVKYNDTVWTVLTEQQLPAIGARVSAHDWDHSKTAEEIYTTLTTDIRPGDILLMHSWSPKTRSVMPRVIATLREQGFTFVTVSELLAMSETPLYAPLTEKPAADDAAPQHPPLVPAGDEGAMQLLENPTFQDLSGDGIPEGWWKLTQREGTLTKHDGEPRFLRLGIRKEHQSSILQQFADLPADATELTVGGQFRWQDIRQGKKPYMRGTLQLMFADAKGKKVGPYHGIAQFSGRSDGWQTVGGTVAVPEGAVKARIQVALYSVKDGVLDVAWVSASAGKSIALPDAQALAAKQTATTEPHEFLSDRFKLPPGDGPEYGGVKGVSLLGKNALDTLKPYRNLDMWTYERVAVEGQPFTDAVRITINEQPAAVWDMQLRGKVNVPINKGDILHLSFWAKGIDNSAEFAETSFLVALQLDKSPWTSVITSRPKQRIGDGWKLVQKVFVAGETFAPGETAFNLQFGLEPQSFEIAGLSCYNYGPTVDPAILPTTKTRLYTGHEPDAPWRAEAAARIEQIRKSDLAVTVLAADGSPVPDARVDVHMTRHAFGWGSAMYIWNYAGDSEKAQTYRARFLELFNLVVPENGLKWGTWEQEKARTYTRSMLKWAAENDVDVRGHTLVWPSFRRSPARLAALEKQPEKLQAEIEAHFRDVLGQTRGQITEWDVMNEPTTNYDFLKILGWDAPADWFKLAKELDPNARMMLNENQILAGTKLKSLENHLDRLIKNDAPIEGIGIQGHLGVGTAAPEKMLAIYDRLARYNIPISITELDVLHDDEDLQAMYLRDVLICAFSHPSVSSVTFWGFWDGRHWKENTPLYRQDWSAKPGLAVYRQLVLDDWWTRESLSTNTDGQIALRAFHGRYAITVHHDGKAETKTLDLGPDATQLTITLAE